ncbi:MAG: S-adenosylmethionine synthetase [Hadesarchaea archaeon CG08_land_8_20_14_0_20_51_8]|jgi:S-adenosylmethionine synthetase|nr:MAG: S-adenosylmethionine synthetase [Hadesarchaea archaeon CG08_land_8_20_14_0_20_51_8]
MSRNIVVEEFKHASVKDQDIEIVERKGIGHPDSLADGMSEAVSRALCREYIKRFNTILHHNTDKVMIVGGAAKPEFGGGKVIKPIYILLAGRGTEIVGDQSIPINDIAEGASKRYLKSTMRHLDIDNHVKLDSRIGRGSMDLMDVFNRNRSMPLANDTSMGIGYAPLSETEELVLKTEQMLNSPAFKKKYPAVGEDIKVMGRRRGNMVDLTIAMAAISPLLEDMDSYLSLKKEVASAVQDLAAKITKMKVDVFVNTADNPSKGVAYITVTGTSAEQGDDGATGRGNRVNGLITPGRPMSLEAAAGKNPVNHVGKIYNLLAIQIAQDVAKLKGVDEAFVKILSQIGKPIDQPHVLNIGVITEKRYKLGALRSEIERIANEWLSNIKKITNMVVSEKLTVF